MYVKYNFLDWFEIHIIGLEERGLEKVSPDCILHKLFWEYILMQLRNGYLISQTNIRPGSKISTLLVKKESAVHQKEQKLIL